MIKSESTKEIAKALSKFQGAVADAKFDSKNPHFKSDYASLEAYLQQARKLLAENGLAISQGISGEKLETVLMHISGESITFEMPLLFSKQDMQGLGSAITYARRYSLGAILGIGSEKDDDGNGTKPIQSESKAIEVITDPSSLGDYIIKFGKKLNGKKLKEVDLNELQGYLDYLAAGAQKSGKPLTGDAAELWDVGLAYLKSQDQIPF
jgi:hypothetical protein